MNKTKRGDQHLRALLVHGARCLVRTFQWDATPFNTQELFDLYENATCGYHPFNEDGPIMEINRTEQQCLGRSADDMVGIQKYRELIKPETRAAFDRAQAAGRSSCQTGHDVGDLSFKTSHERSGRS